MRIEVQRRADHSEQAVAKVTIRRQPRDVVLPGICIRQPQPGWITLEVPPLERWESSLRQLLPQQRQRIESPEFYEILRRTITQQFLRLEPPGSLSHR